MSKQHLAIYLPSLRGGGAERVMVTLANGFASRGHRVDLVLARAEGAYLTEVAPAVRVVDLNKGRVLASLLPLARYLRRERPDAILSALNHANIVAILARKIARVPIRLVVSERNSLVSLRGSARGHLFRTLMRWCYPFADLVVSVSRDGARELVSELGLPDRLVMAIPNPVPVEEIKDRASVPPDHPWLAPGSPPVVLAVGRLEAQKDYPTLLRAFTLLRRNRDLRLIILGEGKLRPTLERQIHELGLTAYVALPGFQPNPFAWMAASDLYVMSSRYEGFPNSLVQAMACGARVVSTDCPTGPAEILDDGKWGRLVPVGDAEALARAMAETLDEAVPPGNFARLTAFRPDWVVQAYEKVLL